MIVEHDVVAPYVSAQRRCPDRSRPAELEPLVVRANADQVRIAERIDLDSADKENIVGPVLYSIEAVAGVAVRFGPPHHPPVPAVRRHRYRLEMRDVHAHPEKDQVDI